MISLYVAPLITHSIIESNRLKRLLQCCAHFSLIILAQGQLVSSGHTLFIAVTTSPSL